MRSQTWIRHGVARPCVPVTSGYVQDGSVSTPCGTVTQTGDRTPVFRQERTHMIGTDTISRVIGHDVFDESGEKIGSASEVYLDDETGQPEWVTVKTGLFGTKESF